MPQRMDQQLPGAQLPQAPSAPVAVPIPAPPTLDSSPEALERQALRERAQALRSAPRAVPVSDVAVIIGIQTRDNGRQETLVDIGQDYRILECTQSVKEKVRAVTQDGQLLGYEPTGEYEFTLKVKYLKDA